MNQQNNRKSWIKPGLYQVKTASGLKPENTQAFRDRYFDLKKQIDLGEKRTQILVSQYHGNLLNLWKEEGNQYPSWMDSQTTNWTQDNFLEFAEQALKWAQDHNEDEKKELQRRVAILILSNQSLAQRNELRELQKQLKSDPVAVVDDQAGVQELLAELTTPNEVVVDKDYQDLKAFSRIKKLSESAVRHTQSVVKQRFDRSRLVRVNVSTENLIVPETKPQQPTKKPKKEDSSQGGPEL